MEQYPDGWYNWKFSGVHDGPTLVRDGNVNNGSGPSVEFCIRNGDTFTPIVWLTVTEHDALTTDRARLVAQVASLQGHLQECGWQYADCSLDLEAIRELHKDDAPVYSSLGRWLYGNKEAADNE